MPRDAQGRRKYCLDPEVGAGCQKRAENKRAGDRRRELASGKPVGRVSQEESADGRATARRGPRYRKFVGEGWCERIESGELSNSAVVAESGESQANVSHWFAAWLEDRAVARAQAAWSMAPDVVAALADFETFRARYFTDSWGDPYLTKGYHRQWIASILRALTSGGRQMILSPPRHGKTDLLIHLCVWLIVTRPNIRIIWIAGNEKVARICVGAVVEILEKHDKLAAEVLGPGGSFKPDAKSGVSWSPAQATVGTRTAVGSKSPTIVALGKGGKIRSRDADAIIADDIQDQEGAASPTTRESDDNWWTLDVTSRQEPRTALVWIGSRVHHDDLAGILKDNPSWNAIVETAHDVMCPLPIHEPREDHSADCPECALHVDCMLFAEVRPMWWLQDRRAEIRNDQRFEMMYMNITRSSGESYVTPEQIERCKNLDRVIGSVPEGTRLIAGLDPAPTRGEQVAFLWAYDMATRKRSVVDIDIRVAGGPSHMREIVRAWFETYRCAEWVIEDNAAQSGWLEDSEFRDYVARNGIIVHAATTTAATKWDASYGILQQFSYFRCDPPLIDLPWGDEPTRDVIRKAIYQWLNFEPAKGRGVKSKVKSDIPMAAWVPENVIRYWAYEGSDHVHYTYDATSYFDSGLGDNYSGILGAA